MAERDNPRARFDIADARATEMQRRAELRRDFLVPVHFIHTSDVPPREARAALEGVIDALNAAGQDRQLLNFGYYDLGGGAYANPNWYVEEAYRKQPLRRDVGYGPQIDVEEVERLFTDDPLQEEPHWKVMVTGVDLNARAGDDYINFVYGATDVRFPSSVQSVRRFMEEIPEGVLRDAVIRRLLRHEVGHMFGLPLREENTVEMLGPHCTNPCTMRQGMSMPEWANLTVEEHNNGIHFCEDCTADLDATRSLYRPLPQGRDAEERAEKPTDTTRTAKESRDESASAEVYFIGSGGEQQEVFPRSETERDDSTDDRER